MKSIMGFIALSLNSEFYVFHEFCVDLDVCF
jgi:hypothetical protein